MNPVVPSARVKQALDDNAPIVALESTIFSELGLPRPHSVDALERVHGALETGGAVAALTAVLDGQIHCGVEPEQYDRICGPATKVSMRDLGLAVAGQLDYGATTVSASLTIAARAGVKVFATGGIGGVHRNASTTSDISADLGAIARWPVVTVTAGAKVFLDLARTVEHLETLGVPVLGWRCDEFPAFHARSSGVPIPATVTEAADVAAVARAHWAMGGGGILVANPIPEDAAIDRAELDRWVDLALERTGTTLHGGPDVTPAVLSELADVSQGRTVEANLALARNNAEVAAAIAVALAAGAPG